jgi:hypothetical protein
MHVELRLYDVTIGAHKTRMRLDDNDAREMGDAAVLVSEPAQQTPHPAPAPIDTKARRSTPNKMRDTNRSAAGS